MNGNKFARNCRRFAWISFEKFFRAKRKEKIGCLVPYRYSVSRVHKWRLRPRWWPRRGDALRQLLCATIKMISTALLSHCEVIDRGSFCLPISICIAFVTGKPIQSTSSGSAICSVRLCDQRLSPKTLIYIQS